jgi:probable F420-dependent oxidoreductase
VNVGIASYDVPVSEFVDLAIAAEAHGFEGIWLGEHLVCPKSYESIHPTRESGTPSAEKPVVDIDTQLVDMWVAIGAAAQATSSLQLATGIYLLPARHPLLTARAAQTAHELSGGRFLLGVGSGWLAEEFAALGIPFEERGQRHEEAIEILRSAFAGGMFSFDGRFYRFDALQIARVRAAIPIIMAGNSPIALRRAALLGDGWFVSGVVDLAQLCRMRDTIEESRRNAGVTRNFKYYVRPEKWDDMSAYRAEGFDHFVVWMKDVWPREGSPSGKLASLAAAAEHFQL